MDNVHKKWMDYRNSVKEKKMQERREKITIMMARYQLEDVKLEKEIKRLKTAVVCDICKRCFTHCQCDYD